MPIDPTCVGAATGPSVSTWSDRDTMMYALGVGAGVGDLSLVTENSHDLPQQVLPTFAVIACDGNSVVAKAGQFDYGQLVHGAQGIRLYRPLQAAGALEVTSNITDVQDKGDGKNAIIITGARGTDPDSGELVVETSSTLVIRGAGGFGGRPGSSAPSAEIQERPADIEITYTTRADQALLYRLSGDRNPLHSDPWFARNRAGFPRTILHGLCTYGFAGRALLAGLCNGDPARLTAMSCRFVAPVFPGEQLVISIWRTGHGRAAFITEADGEETRRRVVLGAGLAEFHPE